jgi:hypothetical protein
MTAKYLEMEFLITVEKRELGGVENIPVFGK